MKFQAPLLLSILLVSSCSHVPHTAQVGSPERSIAQERRIAEEFFRSAFKAQDNVLYKSGAEMESKLLSEIKANPAKYGISQEAAGKLKKIDSIKNERVMAEILSEAPGILKFSKKMKAASVSSIMHEGGLASHVSFKSIDVSKVKLELHEQTGLGREISLRVKNFQNVLVEAKMVSPAQAKKIADNIFQAAKDLSKMAKGDPSQLILARQITDYSMAISEKTGKQFLGKGGCMKLNGRTVLEAKADIAFKTLDDVNTRKLASYEEIGEALQKNHADVTNRTKKESCLAIKALTVGPSCGNVYSPNLAPKGC